MDFRKDINALRAFAVAIVVLFHFKVTAFAGGFIGVDIFFVISGFLMTKIIMHKLESRRFSYIGFIQARFVRICPALVLLVFSLLVLGALFLPPLDYMKLSKEAMAALGFYSNAYYGVGQGYFATEVDERWLLHTWSLSVEWQFYMLYPIFLMITDKCINWIVFKFPMVRYMHLMLIALLCTFAVSLAISVIKTDANAASAFFKLHSRAWEMVGGGMVFILSPSLKEIPATLRRCLQCVGLVLLICALILAGDGWEFRWPGYRALLPVLGTMLVIAGGSGNDLRMPTWVGFNPLQKTGLWSYSIYLWHWPVVVLMNFLLVNLVMRPYAIVVGIIIAIGLGAMSFTLIESRFKLKNPQTWRQSATLIPLAVMAFSAFSAAVFVKTDGWLARTGKDAEFYRAYTAVRNSEIYPVECSNFQKEKSALKTCVLNAGVPGPKTLVYGDSHAEHLYAWFKKNAKGPVEFITSGGCTPVGGFDRRTPGYHCSDFNNFAHALAKMPEYKTIVVAGQWNGSFGVRLSTLCDTRTTPCNIHEQVDRASFIEANRVDWQSWLELGKRVVVVSANAQANFNLPDHAMRRKYLDLPVDETFVDQYILGDGVEPYVDAVASRLTRKENFYKVDLRNEMCEGVICQAIDKKSGLPVLIDNNHFSPGWIEKHGDAFFDVLNISNIF